VQWPCWHASGWIEMDCVRAMQGQEPAMTGKKQAHETWRRQAIITQFIELSSLATTTTLTVLFSRFKES
jgi:hypothetical protein